MAGLARTRLAGLQSSLDQAKAFIASSSDPIKGQRAIEYANMLELEIDALKKQIEEADKNAQKVIL